MNVEHRTTTSLHEVRAFLFEQGAATPPWTSGAAAVDALYALLRERRDDERFWVRLEALLERLEDVRVRPELITGAEALGGAAVGQLLSELRGALPPSDDGPDDARSWARGASAARVLAAFLLLGTAVGCQPQLNRGDDDDIAGANDDDDVGICVEAVALELEGNDADVYCELLELIEGADVPTSIRLDVLECLPILSAATRAALVDQFRTLDDDELAEALQELAWSWPCNADEDDDDADH
jgi:hypothetical protein